jgi:hypothetical protein
MTITGGCRCGAVRYIIDTEPLFARHCWCRDCQYIGAGSGTVNIFFPSEADDPELGKPQITIWTSSAPSWASFDPGLPQEERQSPPGK